MKRSFLTVAGSILGLAILATAAVAANSVVDLVPPEALGFAAVQNLGHTDEKLESLGRKMQVPIPSLLDQLKKEGGITEGLDERGSAAMIAMPAMNSDEPPIMILVVPVDDYEKFLGQFEPEEPKGGLTEITAMDAAFVAANKDGYALLAEPKHRKTLKAVLADKKGPGKEVDALADWLAANDASLVVTRPGVVLISEKIQKTLREMKDLFDSMEGQEAEVQGNFQMMSMVFSIYGEFAAAMGREVATLSAGVQLPDDGSVVGVARLQAVEGGRLDRTTRNLETPVNELLVGIPAGPYVLAGGMAFPEGLVDAMSDFSAAVIQAAPGIYGVPEDKIDEMTEINRKTMENFHGMSMALKVGEPGSPIYGNLSGAMFVDDAEKYLDTYREAIEEMKKLADDAEKSVFAGMKVKQFDLDGKKALRLTMNFASMLPMMDEPEIARMFEAMYGPGGKMTFLMAAANEKTVAMGSTEELLEDAIESVEGDNLADDTELKKTAARLLPGAQAVGYYSVPGLVALIDRAIPAIAPPGTPEIDLPPFPDTPPIGFAAKASEGTVNLQTIVPGEVLGSLMGYFIQVQMQQMQQQQLENAPADQI